MNPRTTILSYALGTGHKRVADALLPALAALGHDAADRPLETWVPWEYDLVFRRGYLFTVFHLQFLWQFLYRSSFIAKKKALAFPLMRSRAWKRFGRIGLGDSDLVVATQYNAMEIAADYKRFTGRPLRLAVIITDYDTYPLWARPEVDLFLVAHQDLVAPLVRLGIPEARVKATGIPIADLFSDPLDGPAVRASLNLAPGKPTALIIGGGLGMGPMEESVHAALQSDDWQIIVVCGYNEKLRARLAPLAPCHPDRLRILGYRHDVPALFAASDVIITKGGGLSLTEALYSGAQVVVVPGCPGQEVANLDYMRRHAWVRACAGPADIPAALKASAPQQRRPSPLPPRPARAAAALLDQLARGEVVPKVVPMPPSAVR